jgi:hypothetical protein
MMTQVCFEENRVLEHYETNALEELFEDRFKILRRKSNKELSVILSLYLGGPITVDKIAFFKRHMKYYKRRETKKRIEEIRCRTLNRHTA